jgi:hypothetical protein
MTVAVFRGFALGLVFALFAHVFAVRLAFTGFAFEAGEECRRL